MGSQKIRRKLKIYIYIYSYTLYYICYLHGMFYLTYYCLFELYNKGGLHFIVERDYDIKLSIIFNLLIRLAIKKCNERCSEVIKKVNDILLARTIISACRVHWHVFRQMTPTSTGIVE